MRRDNELNGRLAAISAAAELAAKYRSLSSQIREANDSFSCFVNGQSQKHIHPKLNDHLKFLWVEELKSMRIDVEEQIVECTLENLSTELEEI